MHMHICCMSLLKDFRKFHKYNLATLQTKGVNLEGRKSKASEAEGGVGGDGKAEAELTLGNVEEMDGN
ncbi:hypothetical protein HK097_002169 [Rhizophlyctis rosea]|uniref:Uncharacterized protein n=1 Tax=Rhizophlyctis rosea TaxID=64517 RepID=A0AAD5SFM5_9FUNG|nr:hypothetical protein HK097_002169 [Rhizophlyctis rosea]